MFGSVTAYLYRALAGLAPAEPGFRRIRFAPALRSGLRSAAAEHITPYGRAAIRWELQGQDACIDLVVPSDTTAEVHLPGKDVKVFPEGSCRILHSYEGKDRDPYFTAHSIVTKKRGRLHKNELPRHGQS
jgi:hypothetical protein